MAQGKMDFDFGPMFNWNVTGGGRYIVYCGSSRVQTGKRNNPTNVTSDRRSILEKFQRAKVGNKCTPTDINPKDESQSRTVVATGRKVKGSIAGNTSH